MLKSGKCIVCVHIDWDCINLFRYQENVKAIDKQVQDLLIEHTEDVWCCIRVLCVKGMYPGVILYQLGGMQTVWLQGAIKRFVHKWWASHS